MDFRRRAGLGAAENSEIPDRGRWPQGPALFLFSLLKMMGAMISYLKPLGRCRVEGTQGLLLQISRLHERPRGARTAYLLEGPAWTGLRGTQLTCGAVSMLCERDSLVTLGSWWRRLANCSPKITSVPPEEPHGNKACV